MEEDPKEREVADKILEAIEKEYGFIPVVNQIMSTRPDLFIPQTRLSKAVFEGKGDLEPKTRYLCAVSAAAATGAEYCISVQMKHAVEAGATQDEVLESIIIGCQIAMTRAQSYALRKYAKQFDLEIDESYLNNVK